MEKSSLTMVLWDVLPSYNIDKKTKELTMVSWDVLPSYNINKKAKEEPEVVEYIHAM
jgi:hypothetical protein